MFRKNPCGAPAASLLTAAIAIAGFAALAAQDARADAVTDWNSGDGAPCG